MDKASDSFLLQISQTPLPTMPTVLFSEFLMNSIFCCWYLGSYRRTSCHIQLWWCCTDPCCWGWRPWREGCRSQSELSKWRNSKQIWASFFIGSASLHHCTVDSLVLCCIVLITRNKCGLCLFLFSMSTRIILHHKTLTSGSSDYDTMKTLRNINLNWFVDLFVTCGLIGVELQLIVQRHSHFYSQDAVRESRCIVHYLETLESNPWPEITKCTLHLFCVH